MQEIQRFVRLLVERYVSVRCSLVAGSLAFTTLLSLVPLVAVALTVIGQLPVFEKLGRALRGFLLENFLPEKAGKVIATYALQFSQNAGDLTLVGSLALIGTAVFLLVTVDRAFNAIWEVRRPRPIWSRLAIYWLAVTLGPLLIAASVALTTQVARASLNLLHEPDWARVMVYRVVSVVLFWAFFGFMYFATPNRRIRASHAALGGLVAALGFVGLQRLLALYFASFPSYTLLYGTFSAVPIFLVWLYASWMVVLLGAVLTAVIPDFVAQRRLLPSSNAGRFYAALQLIAALERAQADGRVCALDRLARESRQRIEETEAMLNALRDQGVVTESDEGDWSLVGAAGQVSAAQLFERFVMPTLDLQRLTEGADAAEKAAVADVVARLNAALLGPRVQIG